MDAASDAGCDSNAGMVSGPDGCVAVLPPRLLSPISTSQVTSHRPSLHWVLPVGTDGAHIELCRDRPCSNPVIGYDVDGWGGVVPLELSAGVYFWRAFGRINGITGRTPSATWQFTVGHRSAPIDTYWGTTFDANGDGYADVILGAVDLGNGNSVPPGLGHAYVYMGSASGLASVPATTLSGPSNGSQFGIVSSAGDVNGDGFADAIVGAPGTGTSSGSAYVYLGGEGGLSSSPSYTIAAPSGGSFGDAVSSAGDINSDGYADVVIGARYVRKGTSIDYLGRAYVYFGGPQGIDTANPITLAGSVPFGGNFGQVVASAGDLNGDGRADLVVSGDDGIPVGSSAYIEQGRAYVYLGANPDPLGTTATTEVHGPSDQEFITVASACDFNGDGFADLALGALGETTELLGSAAGFGSNSTLSMPFVQKPNTTLAYSYRVVSGGDINGDGYDDIVASYDSIYTYFGGAQGASAPPATFTPPDESASIYGYDVVGVGDINGDGFADVVIGARFANQFTGRAYVYLGTANGLATSPALVLLAPDGIGGRFG